MHQTTASLALQMQSSADYLEKKKIICAKLFPRENTQRDDERFLFLLLIHISSPFPLILFKHSFIPNHCIPLPADTRR